MNAVTPIPNQQPVTTAPLDQVPYAIMEKVIAENDLSRLTPKERVMFYKNVCDSLNLNPMTQPFEFIKFDGKWTLYAKRSCTEQLRNLHNISVIKVEKEVVNDVFLYTAFIRKANGQEDVGTGAVAIKGLQGKALANAYKIAETQAKRRATLSICGLGWCDESEIPDVAGAERINMDYETGDLIETKTPGMANLLPPYQKMLDDIFFATNLMELKTAYEKAYRAYAGNGNHPELKTLTELKDKRKAEIEETQEITNFHFGQVDGQTEDGA